jgi:hypothetical protein
VARYTVEVRPTVVIRSHPEKPLHLMFEFQLRIYRAQFELRGLVAANARGAARCEPLRTDLFAT